MMPPFCSSLGQDIVVDAQLDGRVFGPDAQLEHLALRVTTVHSAEAFRESESFPWPRLAPCV